MTNRLLAHRGRSGAHPLNVNSAFFLIGFQPMRKNAQEEVRGRFIPRLVGAPSGGRMGKGCERQAPLVPKGEWGLPCATLGGAGENCSRQGCCAPELRGRRGLTSSICVISACANIHRISPHFGLRLIKEPRGICLSWCKHDRCHKDSKEPRGICNRFFRLLPTCKGGT